MSTTVLLLTHVNICQSEEVAEVTKKYTFIITTIIIIIIIAIIIATIMIILIMVY